MWQQIVFQRTHTLPPKMETSLRLLTETLDLPHTPHRKYRFAIVRTLWLLASFKPCRYGSWEVSAAQDSSLSKRGRRSRCHVLGFGNVILLRLLMIERRND